MQYHLFQHYLTGVFHTQCYHGKAVSHQDHIHASVVSDMSAWEVMSSDHGDWFILLVECAEGVDGNLLPLCG